MKLWQRLASILCLTLGVGLAEAQEFAPGLAMHGTPALPPDFTHFPYTDPGAPKGGSLALAAIGTFDNTNPFIIKGAAVTGTSLIFDTLTEQSQDEPFTEYGLLAESIRTPEDRSWVEFRLRPEARWADGQPVTAEDVVWTFETLRDKGAPFYRAYYADVTKVETTDERTVRFTFDGKSNRELPLILGQLTVLPKHWWAGKDFEQTTLEPLLGSGPYRIKRIDAGRSIVYERDPNYWGAKLPVNVGRFNYDEIRYEYFRDPTVALEAFKAGQFDLRLENSSRFWATGYDGPALTNGLIVKEEIPTSGGGGVQGYVFNLRRPVFQDPKVRKALAYAFDFEWTNKTLFYGSYMRTKSYFANTELAAEGTPSPAELALLEPHRAQLPPEVFGPTYEPPVTDGSGNLRDNLREAVKLFKEAGYEVKGGKLVNTATGQPLSFEILLDQGGLFERITGPFAKNLERLGITVTLRTVDDIQYERRLETFDYDMITNIWGQSNSPGNEQRNFWGSKAADMQGSSNYIGIKDPIVDELIDRIIQAHDRDALIAACRALDRVLTWHYYIIPHWYNGVTRVAEWDKFGRPTALPQYGLDLFAWWIDPAKLEALDAKKKSLGLR